MWKRRTKKIQFAHFLIDNLGIKNGPKPQLSHTIRGNTPLLSRYCPYSSLQFIPSFTTTPNVSCLQDLGRSRCKQPYLCNNRYPQRGNLSLLLPSLKSWKIEPLLTFKQTPNREDAINDYLSFICMNCNRSTQKTTRK